jgi:hypothetical protein
MLQHTGCALSNGVGLYDFKTQDVIHDFMSCDYCFYPTSFTLLDFVMCIKRKLIGLPSQYIRICRGAVPT